MARNRTRIPVTIGAFILRAPEGFLLRSSATIRTVFQKYLSAVDEGYVTDLRQRRPGDFGRAQDAKGKGKKGKNDRQKGKGKDAKGKGKNRKGDQKGTEGDRKGKGTLRNNIRHVASDHTHLQEEHQ